MSAKRNGMLRFEVSRVMWDPIEAKNTERERERERENVCEKDETGSEAEQDHAPLSFYLFIINIHAIIIIFFNVKYELLLSNPPSFFFLA